MPSLQPQPGPPDAGGVAAGRPAPAPLFAIGPAEPGPAIRRGALVAVPIGLCLLVELGLGTPTKGAIATGALLAGFPGLDAPARPRAGWQAAAAPAIGLAAALGVLSGQTIPTAVLALGLLGAAAGYCFAASLRLAIYGLSVTLATLITQGLFLTPGDAVPALLCGIAGGFLQALWSLLVWLLADRAVEDPESAWDAGRARVALRENLTLTAPAARHALRFGAALAVGVATYRLLGLRSHGFWIPLTILFVMRPERGETDRRLVLRAVGTALGLVLATAAAEAFGGDDLAL
ncbi:MAG: FUSC family protein, partial [Syntrophothermus sp.]